MLKVRATQPYRSVSAGVDPVSRRALWEVLLEHKSDLAILLVTHYTDEADILSDQVSLDTLTNKTLFVYEFPALVSQSA